jgi:hypothetical protein
MFTTCHKDDWCIYLYKNSVVRLVILRNENVGKCFALSLYISDVLFVLTFLFLSLINHEFNYVMIE